MPPSHPRMRQRPEIHKSVAVPRWARDVRAYAYVTARSRFKLRPPRTRRGIGKRKARLYTFLLFSFWYLGLMCLSHFLVCFVSCPSLGSLWRGMPVSKVSCIGLPARLLIHDIELLSRQCVTKWASCYYEIIVASINHKDMTRITKAYSKLPCCCFRVALAEIIKIKKIAAYTHGVFYFTFVFVFGYLSSAPNRTCISLGDQ